MASLVGFELCYFIDETRAILLYPVRGPHSWVRRGEEKIKEETPWPAVSLSASSLPLLPNSLVTRCRKNRALHRPCRTATKAVGQSNQHTQQYQAVMVETTSAPAPAR